MDNNIRELTKAVIECECWFGRMNTWYSFNGQEYNSNRVCDSEYERVFVQTDKIRGLYDTYEMINDISYSDGESYIAGDIDENELDYEGRVSTNKKQKRKRGRPRKTLTTE